MFEAMSHNNAIENELELKYHFCARKVTKG